MRRETGTAGPRLVRHACNARIGIFYLPGYSPEFNPD